MKRIFFLLSFLFISTITFSQTKVGDATLPNTVQFSGQTLVLNGAGIREKLWFDLYACGLYLPIKSSDASKIVAADEIMGIKLHILSSLVSNKKLIEAFKKGINDTNNKADVKRLNSKVNVFLSLIENDIAVDKVFDIVYFPNRGLSVFENNEELGVIEGLDFKKLVFNIWLASPSVDDGLKNNLLSK